MESSQADRVQLQQELSSALEAVETAKKGSAAALAEKEKLQAEMATEHTEVTVNARRGQ